MLASSLMWELCVAIWGKCKWYVVSAFQKRMMRYPRKVTANSYGSGFKFSEELG